MNFQSSLSIPTAMVRRSGSSTTITNGRGGGNTSTGQGGGRLATANRNQLEPSPQELPVKDTDHAIDIASAERELLLVFFFVDFISTLFENYSNDFNENFVMFHSLFNKR